MDKSTERELFKAAQCGNKEALARLTDYHEGLIYHCLKGIAYFPSGYDVEDFIQEGAIALMRAIHKFDPDKGICFSTYACTSIKNQFNYLFRRAKGIDRANADTIPLDAPLYGDEDDRRTGLDKLAVNEHRTDELSAVDINLWIEQNFNAEEAKVLKLSMQGCRGKEIAGLLNMDIGHVRKIQRRIRNRKRQLKSLYIADRPVPQAQ